MSRLLFRVKHGLHLYGLATANTPIIYYEIWDRLPSDAKTISSENTFKVSEIEFIRRLNAGGQDEVEALTTGPENIIYSQITALIPILRERLLSTGSGTIDILQESYRKRIKQLARSDFPEHRRQSARLLHDLDRLMNEGWFKPDAFSRTSFADLSLYQDGLPILPERWSENLPGHRFAFDSDRNSASKAN